MAGTQEPTPTRGSDLPADELSEAAARDAAMALPPSLQAASTSDYLKASLVRVKGGETGILPVLAGLVLISIVFQAANSHFLTAPNLVNLLIQAAVFSLLAMAEVFVLVLGEIDLSTGFVAGLGGAIMAELLSAQTHSELSNRIQSVSRLLGGYLVYLERQIEGKDAG